MKRALVPVLLLAAAAVAVGVVLAAGGGDEPARAATPTYYQDVKPILDGRCAGCHYAGGIAPFALTSYDEARAHGRAIEAAVTSREMPPWHAARDGRAYSHDPSLEGEQIETIASWVAASAPAGDSAEAAEPLPPVTPKLSHVDLRLQMPTAYTPQQGADDDYRCFVLPWSPDATTHVTGVDVAPGEPAEVHHIILFLAPPGSAAMLERWDAAEPGAGYGCYGGPSATGAPDTLRTPQFVAGWVPGSAGGDLPAGSGIEVEPGSRLILQVHYNLEYAAPRPDRSAVELSLAEHVERRGLYVPLVNPGWVIAPETFAIPAGRKKVVHEFGVDVRPVAAFLASMLDLTKGFEIHRVALHMHRLGVNGEIVLRHENGERERLLSVPRWDFHWQREYALAEPAAVGLDDRLSIRCEHDNSAAGQPVVGGRRAAPRHVTWGENSSDEMCIGFLYVTAA
jgi:hypothetical protein